jgi:hypothetical protein
MRIILKATATHKHVEKGGDAMKVNCIRSSCLLATVPDSVGTSLETTLYRTLNPLVTSKVSSICCESVARLLESDTAPLEDDLIRSRCPTLITYASG